MIQEPLVIEGSCVQTALPPHVHMGHLGLGQGRSWPYPSVGHWDCGDIL